MVSTEAKLDKEKAERKDVDGKFKTRFEDIEANFEDMKVQLKKEKEERSDDSSLKDEYNRKLGEISAQLNEMKVQQQQARKDKKEWKEQQGRKTNENLKDGKHEM